jgi:hypothetical protein
MTLNAALLALSGGSVYALLQWRAAKLPEKEQHILRNEVLVARASAKEKSFDSEIEAETDRVMEERLKQNPLTPVDKTLLRNQIKEQIKAQTQIVVPGSYRLWEIDLGMAKNYLHDKPLYLRVKFNAAQKNPSGTFLALWQAGLPERKRVWRDEMSLAPDTFHEFEIPPDLYDDNGVLSIAFINMNETTLLFPLSEGMEVLYRESGFGVNFMRGLGIILCWMALLAALGLASASFLSFPVAAFFSLAVLVITLSSSTIASVVSEGTITGYGAHDTGPAGSSIVDSIAIPIFRAVLRVINLVKNFSPIDSLSTGRSISWTELGRAIAQIVLLLGGIIGSFGIFVFSRRELATAQGTQ